MTMHEAIAALEAAKASGDVAAIIAAAEAVAAAGSEPAPKAPRKPRAPKDDRPAWFTADAKVKGKTARIKHSLAVRFEDGQAVRVNAWQAKADAPIAVGRALHVAVAFLRHRAEAKGGAAAFRGEVPGFASVELVDGEAFDAAECSLLTTEARARISAPEAEAAEARIARLTADRDWHVAALARAKRDAIYAEARAVAVVIPEGEGPDAKAAAATRDGIRAAAACEVRNAERMVAQYERFLAEAGGAVGESKADSPVRSFEREDILADIEAEPLHEASPDGDEDDAVSDEDVHEVQDRLHPCPVAVEQGRRIPVQSMPGGMAQDTGGSCEACGTAETLSAEAGDSVASPRAANPTRRRKARTSGARPVRDMRNAGEGASASRRLCKAADGSVAMSDASSSDPSVGVAHAADCRSAREGGGIAPEAPSPVLADPGRPSTWMRTYAAEMVQRQERAREMAAPGHAVRMVNADGVKALAGPDPSKPGGFRLTRFCLEGFPHGHIGVDTLEEACELGLRMGYEPAPPVRRLDAPPPVRSFDPDRAAARAALDEQQGRDGDEVREAERMTLDQAAARIRTDCAAPPDERLALVILPLPGGEARMTNLARGGALHLAGDIMASPAAGMCVQAWIDDAYANGLEVVDLRRPADPGEPGPSCEAMGDGAVAVSGAASNVRRRPFRHALDRDRGPVGRLAEVLPAFDQPIVAGQREEVAIAMHLRADLGRGARRDEASSGTGSGRWDESIEVETLGHGAASYRPRPPPLEAGRCSAVDRRAA